jgi:hypothetical protein
MSKRVLAIVLCTLIVAVVRMAAAESDSSPVASGSSYDDWRRGATVLAIAPDGTWGVATDGWIGRAIALAIAECKRKYQRDIGCGHRFTTIREGWSLAFRCGSENIIVAEKNLADAEQLARRQERDLRAIYVPNMPACVRTVTVDPSGAVVVPTVGYSNAVQNGR